MGLESLLVTACIIGLLNLVATFRSNVVLDEVRRCVFMFTEDCIEEHEHLEPPPEVLPLAPNAAPVQKRKPVAMTDTRAYVLEQKERAKDAKLFPGATF